VDRCPQLGNAETVGVGQVDCTFPIIAADAGVAERWGELVAYADARGHPRPVNDSWIAACCLTYGLPLATLNAADFADFAEFEGLELL